MKNFEIQFSGLKLGTHQYEYKIEKSFFESFQDNAYNYVSVYNSNIEAVVTLEKKETMLVFDFEIKGEIGVDCDRCASEMTTQIETERKIIGKFSDEETWHEDNIIHIGSQAFKFDVSDLLFEFIMLAVPAKNVHPEGECDVAMLEKLEQYRITENKEEDNPVDPRWEKLKNLK